MIIHQEQDKHGDVAQSVVFFILLIFHFSSFFFPLTVTTTFRS